MKVVIEIKKFSPPPGKEYDASQYPGPGLYQNPTTMVWYLVYAMAGSTSGSVAEIGCSALPPFPSTPSVESAGAEPTISGITAADMLKAIAISQNPLLAKELLK